MELTLTTPALLFPALSLLLLAYTNRFLTLANLIRELHRRYQTEPSVIVAGQIRNLRLRIELIRDMQAFGIASLFFCVLSMMLLFLHRVRVGEIVFAFALFLMLISLALSLWETSISVGALKLQLSDMEHSPKSP